MLVRSTLSLFSLSRSPSPRSSPRTAPTGDSPSRATRSPTTTRSTGRPIPSGAIRSTSSASPSSLPSGSTPGSSSTPRSSSSTAAPASPSSSTFEEFGEFETEVEKGGEVEVEKLEAVFSARAGVQPPAWAGFYVARRACSALTTSPIEYFSDDPDRDRGRAHPGPVARDGRQRVRRSRPRALPALVVNGLDSTGFSSANWIVGGWQKRFEQVERPGARPGGAASTTASTPRASRRLRLCRQQRAQPPQAGSRRARPNVGHRRGATPVVERGPLHGAAAWSALRPSPEQRGRLRAPTGISPTS